MRANKRLNNGIIFILLIILFVVLFFMDIVFGSVEISVSDIFAYLKGDANHIVNSLLTNFRIPKAIVAVLAGMALSVSGLQMQTLFRNPLAGPYVLGVSSGASLGVSIFLLGLPLMGASGTSEIIRNTGIIGSAWIGAAAILFIVMFVSSRIKDIMVILILGMMIGSGATAIVDLLQYLSPESALKSFVVWTMGSLGAVSPSQLKIMTFFIVIGLVISVFLIKPLNLLLLGESYARTMGVKVKSVRILIFITTILLAGSVTAFCGPIGFIGIAIPHITALIFSNSDHKILVPGTILLGGIILLGCDIVSQLPGFDMVLPINTVTSFVGIPVVLLVILKNKKLS